MEKTGLKDMTLSEMEEFIMSLGERKFRAKQICTWIFQKGAASFEEMTDLSRELRTKLSQVSYINNLKILARQESRLDATTKYLFELDDKETVESVYLKYDYGATVCVSTQVGCKMGCGFCASTLGGFQRNLTAGEIFDQILQIQKDKKEKIRNIVIMGSGEPLDNYYNTLKFLELVHAPYSLNIGYRHITLSTCGIVPKIKELAAMNLPITLSISLHAPNDDLRNRLMPVNKKYPLSSLMEVCSEYIQVTGRRISFEYALIAGFNDSPDHARELAVLLKGLLCHVNLIPLNPVRERNLKRTRREDIIKFKNILEKKGIPSTVRRELGADIDAACGQLRNRIKSSLV